MFEDSIKIFRKRSKELNESNDRIKAHSFDLLQSQIWSLLPPFCSNANDVKDNFKVIAKTLGVLIGDRKELRLAAMAALRKMIAKNQGMSQVLYQANSIHLFIYISNQKLKISWWLNQIPRHK